MGRWDASDRRSRLPGDWAKRRAQVFKRDGYRCVWVERGKRCTEDATDCDHIIPNDDHGLENLRALCAAHHDIKTREDLAAKRREIRQRFRRTETHPGLV